MENERDIQIAFGQYRKLDLVDCEDYDLVLQGITVNPSFALFIYDNREKIPEIYTEEVDQIIKETIQDCKEKEYFGIKHEGYTVLRNEIYHPLLEYATMNKLMLELKMGADHYLAD